MSSVFDHMVDELSKEAFRDYGAKKITRAEYEQFLKDVIFEKLKGKRLGQYFTERFCIRDRVLSSYTEDASALHHIKWCKYIDETEVH